MALYGQDANRMSSEERLKLHERCLEGYIAARRANKRTKWWPDANPEELLQRAERRLAQIRKQLQSYKKR